nr:XRE family transcriptional regulator [uncultured Gellertiella sp.]
MMESQDHIVEEGIGSRLRQLRADRGMTLEALQAASGVSRAMISRIERGEASPTAALLARLCTALGLSLSRFFAEEGPGEPFLRRKDQHVWQDPETGYVRRAVSPGGAAVDLVDVSLPPGKRVSFPPQAASRDIFQHVWLLEGELTMDLAGDIHRLEAGDCLYHDIGRGHSFINEGTATARYAVVLEHRSARQKG